MTEQAAPRRTLDAAAALDDIRAVTPVQHLYVHVPFCVRKCPYCDFNSHAGRDEEMDRYLDALEAEARAFAPHVRAKTVFVGGGTPTHLPAPRLARLLRILAPLRARGPGEFTVEANPGSLDLEKVRVLRDGGVDRVSLGVQTFDDRHLKTLGRAHDAADAVRSLEVLHRGGLARLSLDLMLAIPEQTLGDQARDLARAVDCAPEHVSAYVLTYEPGTAFTKMRDEGRLPMPESDRELDHLHAACEAFAAAGLQRYEVSNFANPNAECLHNLAYWRNTDWIGIGAGAHSHCRGVRWKNVDDPAAYAGSVALGMQPIEWEERVDSSSQALEGLLMGLRLIEGVDLGYIADRSGVDPRVVCRSSIAQFEQEGLLVHRDNRLRATARGLDLLDGVLRVLAAQLQDVERNRPSA